MEAIQAMETVDAAAYAAADLLRAWGAAVFSRLGLPDEDAALVAESIVWASLRGVDSHGVMRIPIYAETLRQGGINPRPQIRIVQETPATVLVDGDNGMGQVVARYAMEAALRKAAGAGASFVLARHTNHFGAAGYWAQMALARDMIGWTTTNTAPVLAPWGSREAIIGNNPLAIAAPAQEEPPLILDMALSMVAGGKLRYAARKGLSIPDDWALGPDGRATTDPVAGLAGTLLPMGKHKGSGLSIMIETLTGLLAGTGWSPDVAIIWEQGDKPGNAASLFGAVDIATFIPQALFKLAVDGMVRRIRSAERVPGLEKIYVPGGPENEVEAQRHRHGIPLPAQVIAEMHRLGETIGVPCPIQKGDGLP